MMDTFRLPNSCFSQSLSSNRIRFAMWLLSVSRCPLSSRIGRKQETFSLVFQLLGMMWQLSPCICWSTEGLPFLDGFLCCVPSIRQRYLFFLFLCLHFLLSVCVFDWFYVIVYHSRFQAQLFSAFSTEWLTTWDSQFIFWVLWVIRWTSFTYFGSHRHHEQLCMSLSL